jgi:uncharacterized protein (TIGR02001 family)
LCAASVAGCPVAAASEFSGIATLTSQYIYRGQSLSDGNPAVQLGLDYEFHSGVFIGVWGSTLDLQSASSRRDAELDYYLGYHYALKVPVSLSATFLRYTYPGQTGSHSYDHNEYLGNVQGAIFDQFGLRPICTARSIGCLGAARHVCRQCVGVERRSGRTTDRHRCG